MSAKIKVLVVDDSAVVRDILARGLALDSDIEVVGTAADPYMARDKIAECKPDVLTLDIEMPRMDGVAFLKRLMPQNPLPVLMVSTLTERGKQITMEALQAGALDFVTKPGSDASGGLNAMMHDLRSKVKAISTANVSQWRNQQYRPPKAGTEAGKHALHPFLEKILAIGASTGGPEAIRAILHEMPATMPGTVIVQHMPAGFTRMFAKSLNEQCALSVKEAETGDQIIPGRVLIAPGDYQMRVLRTGDGYTAVCNQGDKVRGHRPSVDVLFESVAENVGADAIGIMLTGMGDDGAKGMLAMCRAGAQTMAQDEATSVVFGMPRKAYEAGGTDKLVALSAMPNRIMSLLSERS